MNTPVALIIFRRPGLTARVLDAVAQARPRTLLVIADGPRADRPDDAAACTAARAVIDRVDWDCAIVKNYADVNLGCGRRPGTGVSWVFEQVEQAIVLEDDCVPHPSFFRFCDELLERYRDDERVMHITGTTYRAHEIPTPYSYFFSQFNGCWGWATWRRAWRHFDASVRLWPELRDTTWLKDLVEDPDAVRYWAHEFDVAYQRRGDVDYWDHQWTFACWAHSGLSIAPRVNLVTNVGCGADSTHFGENDPLGNVPSHEMMFPLVHPPNVLQRRHADREFLQQLVLPRLKQPSTLRSLAARVAPAPLKQGYRQLAKTIASVRAHRAGGTAARDGRPGWKPDDQVGIVGGTGGQRP